MVRVDSKGRVVLPQTLRERLGITPGTEVEVREEDGQLVVEPEDDPERILERMEELVAATASERTETEPPDGVDPLARRHRETIERGARRDDDG
jgi:AbrB family looped-hinge helix DNA binding protein